MADGEHVGVVDEAPLPLPLAVYLQGVLAGVEKGLHMIEGIAQRPRVSGKLTGCSHDGRGEVIVAWRQFCLLVRDAETPKVLPELPVFVQ